MARTEKHTERSKSKRTASAGAANGRKAKPLLTAKTADKHLLYQKSVQNADIEIDFIDRVYRSERKRLPKAMREDFCGTALVTSGWVQKDRTRTAVGVDLDPKVLAWAKAHNLGNLGEALERVELLEQDVRAATKRRFDVINAFNFSYWVFKTRPELRQYFETVRRSLNSGGIFFLDAYGGWEAQEPMLEPRRIPGGFTYVWDQDKFDPISHRVLNHIHFEFKDGTKLKKAFTYDWRYWTLPELQELLTEAGFSDVQVHWDVSDDADGDDYRPRKRAANQPGWLAYIVALR